MDELDELDAKAADRVHVVSVGMGLCAAYLGAAEDSDDETQKLAAYKAWCEKNPGCGDVILRGMANLAKLAGVALLFSERVGA